MHPFDFIILFFSFVYALALTHLLLAVTAMFRHRRKLTFSAPHTIWMFNALLFLIANWISLWDFHDLAILPLGSILIGFFLCVMLYLICALVSPSIESGLHLDLRRFHLEQGRMYVGGVFILLLFAVVTNAEAGSMGAANWVRENAVVLPMVPITGAALLFRKELVQAVLGLSMTVLTIAYLIVYYPVLK